MILSYLKQYSGKSVSEQESEAAKPSVNIEEIRAEIKAKIEEEAYNKGWGFLSCSLTNTHCVMALLLIINHHIYSTGKSSHVYNVTYRLQYRQNTMTDYRTSIHVKNIKCEHFNSSFQEGLKQSKALLEEKQEETAAETLLESKDKDEESGKKMKTSR